MKLQKFIVHRLTSEKKPPFSMCVLVAFELYIAMCRGVSLKTLAILTEGLATFQKDSFSREEKHSHVGTR